MGGVKKKNTDVRRRGGQIISLLKRDGAGKYCGSELIEKISEEAQREACDAKKSLCQNKTTRKVRGPGLFQVLARLPQPFIIIRRRASRTFRRAEARRRKRSRFSLSSPRKLSDLQSFQDSQSSCARVTSVLFESHLHRTIPLGPLAKEDGEINVPVTERVEKLHRKKVS